MEASAKAAVGEGSYENPWLYRIQLLLLTILTISSVSSTVLQITQTEGSTSGVSISGSLELREVKNEK